MAPGSTVGSVTDSVSGLVQGSTTDLVHGARLPGSEGTASDIWSTLTAQLPDTLTVDQRPQIDSLLTRYDDIFSRGSFDVGRTTLVEHGIDTGSNRPIRQGLRRHPMAHLDVVDKQVDE